MKLIKYSGEQVAEKLAELNFADEVLWCLEDHKLTKTFQFKDFQTAFGFMSMTAIYCEKIDHHPDWRNNYNKVTVKLFTYDVDGISYKDFKLGEKMDEIASCLEI